jgi:phosphopantetheinyl transferase
MMPKADAFTIDHPLPRLEIDARLALLDIDASPGLAAARRTHLTARERRGHDRLGTERRRTGWLAARVCLKESLARWGVIAHPKDCEIESDAGGRPRLAIRARSDGTPDCSLSHSGRWALAAWGGASSLRIGVDLEARSVRWEARRLSVVTPEDDAGRELPPGLRAAVLWTLKEAAAKALGTGLGGALDSAVHQARGSLCRIDTGGGRVLAGRYGIGPGWILAVAWSLERSSECRAF